MYSVVTRPRYAWIVAVVALSGVALAGWLGWGQPRRPHRPHYVLINETGTHDYDLAFRMSLKLAESKSGIENALVLLAALPPSKSIEQTAVDLFSRLRIGARTNGRGILYLYSARENLLKIEVSYALEGDITDIYCHAVEEAARTYMLSEIPQDFISELIITTNLRGMGAARDFTPWSRPQWLSGEFLSGGGGALVHGYSKTFADLEGAIRRLPQAELQQYLPASTAEGSAQRYLASLAAGVGDPRLPLLTEGSQLFRAVVPRDAAQQQRIAEYFRSAAPYRLLFAGDLAVAVPQPDHSNLPVVLHRGKDGLWYVDEAKSWTYFHRFEDDVNFFVKYSDNPFLPGLQALNLPHMEHAIYAGHVGTPRLRPYPSSLSATIQSLEAKIRAAPQEAANYAALGDLYLFEANWISKAIACYEMASALAPAAAAYHWRLMDLYLNTSQADKMLGQLEYLSEHLPADAQTRAWYRYYKKAYEFADD
jgi:TLP18.3/Psb32/MOLO-1 phosphatase superfamily protein